MRHGMSAATLQRRVSPACQRRLSSQPLLHLSPASLTGEILQRERRCLARRLIDNRDGRKPRCAIVVGEGHLGRGRARPVREKERGTTARARSSPSLNKARRTDLSVGVARSRVKNEAAVWSARHLALVAVENGVALRGERSEVGAWRCAPGDQGWITAAGGAPWPSAPRHHPTRVHVLPLSSL